MEVTLNLNVPISVEDVEEIIEGAGYVEQSWMALGEMKTEDCIFVAHIYNDEDSYGTTRHELSYQHVVTALEQVAKTNINVLNDLTYKLTHGEFAGEMDAEDYDEILQVALFGDVVYG
jgi:hypothetical protein